MKNDADTPADLSSYIAEDIRQAILSGELDVDQRLPSESELAEFFDVSRPTVREALKRLAAQSLIRTQRGAAGGAFVNHLKFEDAYDSQVTLAALLLMMNDVGFDVACEARFTLERACAPMAATRRNQDHLDRMRKELERQADPSLSDEAFCASDVAFHRAFVDAACNPVLGFQLAGAIEGMQPLMNMITFSDRSRQRIHALHSDLLNALDSHDAQKIEQVLFLLETDAMELAEDVMERRRARASETAN